MTESKHELIPTYPLHHRWSSPTIAAAMGNKIKVTLGDHEVEKDEMVKDFEALFNDKVMRRQKVRSRRLRKAANKGGNPKRKVKPHSGLEENEDINNLACMVESLLLFGSTKYATTVFRKAFLACVFAVYNSTKTSWILSLANLIRTQTVFDAWDEYSMQDVLNWLKGALGDWQVFSKHHIFDSFSALLTYMVTLGWIKDGIDLSWGKLELLRVEALKTQVKATDFITALWETVVFILEGIKHLLSGTFYQFLQSTSDMVKFESLYLKLKDQFDLVVYGKVDESIYLDVAQYEFDLSETLLLGRKLMGVCPSKDKLRVTTYLKDLIAMKGKFLETVCGGDLRMAPFALLIHGNSSVGKSTLSSVLLKYLLKVNGYSCSAAYIAYLNLMDKYFPNVKPYTTGISIDDICNAIADMIEGSPLQTLLEFINNVPMYLNQAAVEDKGKISANPKVLTATTNIKHLNAEAYTLEPASIMRRFAYHLHVEVKPKFRVDGGVALDRKKLMKYEAEKIQAAIDEDKAYVPDIWDIRVYHVHIKEDKNKSGPNDKRHKPSRYELVLEKKFSNMGELEIFLKEASREHFEAQKLVVDGDTRLSKMEFCKSCGAVECHCICPHGGSPEDIARLEMLNQLPNVEKLVLKEDEFKMAMTEFFVDTKDSVRNLFNILEEHFAGLCVAHLYIVQKVVRKLFTKYVTPDWTMWLPNWVEGTPVGSTLTRLYRPKLVSSTRLVFGIWNCVRLQVGIWALNEYLKWCSVRLYTREEKFVENVVALGIFLVYVNVTRVSLPAVYHWIISIIAWLGSSSFSKVLTTAFWAMVMVSEGLRPGLGLFLGSSALLWNLIREEIRVFKEVPDTITKSYAWLKREDNEYRDKVIPNFCGGYLVYKMLPRIIESFRTAVEKSEPHTRLDPTPEEAAQLDKEVSDKWYQPPLKERILDFIPMTVGRSPSELANRVKRNLVYVRDCKTRLFTNGVFITSGILLVPSHFAEDLNGKVEIIRKTIGVGCGNAIISRVVDKLDVLSFVNLDLALISIPNSGDFANIIDCFPDRIPKAERTGTMFYRNRDGNVEEFPVVSISPKITTNNYKRAGKTMVFPGFHYVSTNATGMCCSPIVSNDKQSFIIGLHIGGDGHSQGRGIFVDPKTLESGISELRSRKHVPVIAEEGEITQHNGEEFFKPELHVRSPLQLVEGQNNFRFMGSVRLRSTPKSRVVDTPIASELAHQLDLAVGWGKPKFRGPDKASPWVPWLRSLRIAVNPPPGFESVLLDRALRSYESRLKSVMKSLVPLTDFEIVNGRDRCRFIDAMDRSTSMGYFWPGTKADWLVPIDGMIEKYTFKEEIWTKTREIEQTYLTGKRAYPLFKACLKDEPTKTTKDKVRVFQAAPVTLQILTRKYFLPIARLLSVYSARSECAVGINPMSCDWGELYHHLSYFPKALAIDYSAFDINMCSQLTFAAFSVLIRFAESAGYSDDQLRIMWGIATDICWALVAYNGDLIQFCGTNPSGQNLTVYINCIVNSLIFRMVYYGTGYNHFNSSVRLMTYGDDAIATTCTNFGMKEMRDFLAERGMTITMADKTAEFVDHVKLDEVDFLRRGFSHHFELDAVVGPLEKESIYKRLLAINASKALSIKEVTAVNIDSALDEFVFWGREEFLKHYNMLIPIAEAHGLIVLCPRIKKCYDDRVYKWRNNFRALPALPGGKSETGVKVTMQPNGHWVCIGEHQIAESSEGAGVAPLTNTSSNPTEVGIMKWINKFKEQVIKSSGLEIPLKSLGVDAPNVYPHAGSEIVTFHDDKDRQNTVPSDVDSTRDRLQGTDSSLGDFLSRPVQIGQYFWSTGTPDFLVFLNPWHQFMINPRVANRVSNYYCGKMKLHVKFVINGNSFFYGRLMASYIPMYGYDTLTQYTTDRLENVQFSQMPKIFLDPTTSEGGTMELPFFWHFDYLNLTNTDITNMGTIVIRTLNDLKFANAAANQNVTITVFAWATEVDLRAPTHKNVYDISPQSGTEDEYGKVSGPATAVANAAGRLSNVPIVGRYARATQVIASTVSGIAKAFGYSAPSIAGAPNLVNPKPTTNMSTVDNPDSGQKLTYDSKQELTIDSRIAGLDGTDEMNIAYLASRESYIFTFPWLKADGTYQCLFSAVVDPGLYRSTPEGTGLKLHIPASFGAVTPFGYWSGSMEFRFQIVASAFHRGRLAICFDPAPSCPTVFEPNVMYTEIIDIATCRDFTIKCPYMQDRAYSQPAGPQVSETALIGTSPVTGANPAFHVGNGTISVWIINELTTPNVDPSVPGDIEVNVYMKACEDFKVMGPSSFMACYEIKPQSGREVDPVSDNNAPVSQADETLEQCVDHDVHHLVYGGEAVKSFRSVIKRYYRHLAFGCTNDDTGLFHSLAIQCFPFYKGRVSGAVHTTSTTNYNFCGFTMLNWLAPAFCGMRGSIRWKIAPRGSSDKHISRASITANLIQQQNFEDSSGFVSKSSRSVLAKEGMFGTVGFDPEIDNYGAIVLANSAVNGVLEVEIPYYSHARFIPGRIENWTTVTPPTALYGVRFLVDNSDSGAEFYETFVAAGEDFSFFFFAGWPPLYYYTTVPTPT
ncbi:hypothetical protein [Wenzhou picorna-like virus 3]|uniref:hypothetical protein n=1 Tax=Wenzhou picorna-like virus 3 TaxID=1923615 RepID=UPI0009093F34|nr:hypothetical protein [Wenzhou picorna-like virus 3]APG78561.1 hypothetical protein [Wenzhou picorna-like virus 3]